MNEKNARASKKQQELLAYLDEFIRQTGYGPSYREIMRALGYKSVSTVAAHIDGLIAKGYVRKSDNSARSLEVVIAQKSEDGTTHAGWLVHTLRHMYPTATPEQRAAFETTLDALGIETKITDN